MVRSNNVVYIIKLEQVVIHQCNTPNTKQRR